MPRWRAPSSLPRGRTSPRSHCTCPQAAFLAPASPGGLAGPGLPCARLHAAPQNTGAARPLLAGAGGGSEQTGPHSGHPGSPDPGISTSALLHRPTFQAGQPLQPHTSPLPFFHRMLGPEAPICLKQWSLGSLVWSPDREREGMPRPGAPELPWRQKLTPVPDL